MQRRHDTAVTRQTDCADQFLLRGLLHRAAGFGQMRAICEAAIARESFELHESLRDLRRADMPEAEVADAGRVDQAAAVRKVIQRGERGGMAAGAGGA